MLFVYYNQFISPQTVALTASAEVLLMVIAGGTGDAARADRRRGAGRRHEERGERLHRALEFPARRDLRRHRHLDAGRPGARHGAAVAAGLAGARAAGAASSSRGSAEPKPMTALDRQRALQGVRRPARHHRRQPQRRAGRAAADHRPERRRQDHAVQSDHRRAHAGLAARSSCSARTSPACRAAGAPHLGMARTYQIITLFAARHHRCATSRWRCSACRRCAGIR